MLAVMGALDEEVTHLRRDMTISEETVHAGIQVTHGVFKDVDIALAKCGIGKVNATICTQMLIDLYQPEAMMFSGVAGGLLPNMGVGDVVVASHLIQYDMDLTAFGRRHGEIPGRDRMIECDPDMVQETAAAFDVAFPDPGVGPNLMLGTIASGDRFIQDQKTLRWLQREFAALATEMEGAAFGYTCHLNEVPFVVIRGLSDTAGHSASDDFSANLHTVSLNMYPFLERLIPALARMLRARDGSPS